jgi:rhamnose transport system ATP-binding protein
MTGVTKSFGGVHAIRQAEFHLMPGEVHALVGENGAGKSTLIKIASGAESFDTGQILIDGSPVTIRSAADALALRVATVYQEAQLFGQLTVAENTFLGRELTRGHRVDWAAQNEQVGRALATVGLSDEFATRKVEELSAAQQQQVSIAKALVGDARILILDEPSAILTDSEIENLFVAIRNLTAQGVSVIYISHRLDELFQIADVVTIMRDGVTLGTFDVGELSVGQIAEAMVGGEFAAAAGRQARGAAEVVLSMRELTSRRFHDVSLDLRSGEVVVLYGLVGSGVAEIAAAAYGQAPVLSGTMRLRGQPYRPTSPAQAKAQGVSMLPANRKREGLFSFQSIAFNICVGSLRLLKRLGVFTDAARERGVAASMIKTLAVKTPDAARSVSTLSGGNAQKVVLARQLVTLPDVLVLAEPTQGVDIGAKEEIHKIVDQLCERGAAVLIATSDLGEAMRIADRLIVIRNGTNFAQFAHGVGQAEVLAAASGELTREQERELARQEAI